MALKNYKSSYSLGWKSGFLSMIIKFELLLAIKKLQNQYA